MAEDKTVIKSSIKAIRAKCLECSNYSISEVRECPVKDCPLYVFRFGKNPYRAKRVFTEEQKKAIGERLKKGKEAKTPTITKE